MATSRDFENALHQVADDLAYVLGTDRDRATRSPFARACTNLSDRAAKGMPSQSQFTGTRGGGHHDLSDRIVPAVAAGRTTTEDQADKDKVELIKQAATVIDAIRQLRKKVDAHTLTVDPGTAARDTSMDECRLCASVGHHSVVLALGLCDWCWRLAKRLTPDPTDDDPEPELVVPHTELVRAHNQGKRVTVNMIAQHHPIPTKADRVVGVDQDV